MISDWKVVLESRRVEKTFVEEKVVSMVSCVEEKRLCQEKVGMRKLEE